jgi:opacity protein-like surface antigen
LSNLHRVAIAAAILASILVSTLLTTTSRGLAQAPGRLSMAVAGGTEIALAQHWSAKLEYLYVDLGTVTNYRF